MSFVQRPIAMLALASVAASPVAAQPALHRLTPGQQAALAAFEAALAAQPSATKALSGWCAAHHLADPAIIVAAPVSGQPAPAPDDLRGQLAVSHEEPLAYRHVRLSCGGIVLSEAHNWYVPARLTPAMNTTLDTTDTPFGTVAAPLHFTREGLIGSTASCPAEIILTHRALLRLPSGEPLALVVECYTRANLAEHSAADLGHDAPG